MTEIFADVIKQWRLADSQRMIFGVDMLQTQNAIEGLTEALEKVLAGISSFSLVLKDQDMEIVVKDGESSLNNIPVQIQSLPKVFKELNVNSITIDAGVTKEELKDFFAGISMKVEDIEPQGGLKGYLEKNGVVHLKVDQMKFQLLRDGEHATSGSGEGDGDGKGGKGVKAKKSIALTKANETLLSEFLGGSLNRKDLSVEHEDLVESVSQEPKQLEKLLKRMIKKAKDSDKFLAHLDQKLSEIGYSADDIGALKKKLAAPKKVLVGEDELAHLRKIEKEYQKDLGDKADETLKTIRTIHKKLTDERERSEAILHQLSEGGVVLDKKGKILSVNATALNVLGCSQKDISGKNIKDILKPHHVLTMVSDWQKETDDHTPKDVKVKALKDETMAIIRESTIVLESENGRSIGVLAALQDVTQQEELNRRKNDILDVLGHDLRAPLGAIKQNFDVLVQSTGLKEQCNDQQKRFLDNCKNNIVRMSRLIEKIMDMRQLETGKIMLKYDVIEAGALLEQAVTSLNEWAANKMIELKINAGKLPEIDGDPERLYQVITNLVSNALKFTPEGGTIVAEGKAAKIKGVDHVLISVKDSGMGISEDDLKRIFDKYEQVMVNTPKGVSGLGLGLSICKTVIDLHGGTIWADSKIEEGSTFTFQIPVKHIPAD